MGGFSHGYREPRRTRFSPPLTRSAFLGHAVISLPLVGCRGFLAFRPRPRQVERSLRITNCRHSQEHTDFDILEVNIDFKIMSGGVRFTRGLLEHREQDLDGRWWSRVVSGCQISNQSVRDIHIHCSSKSSSTAGQDNGIIIIV